MLTRREALTTAGLAALALGSATDAGAQARTLTAEEQANMKVVEGFVAAMNARDVKAVASFLADDGRFAAGPIGKFPALRPPMQAFDGFLRTAKSVRMMVKPGSTQARGPMVTHERIDEIVMENGSTNGSGTWFGVYGL